MNYFFRKSSNTYGRQHSIPTLFWYDLRAEILKAETRLNPVLASSQVETWVLDGLGFSKNFALKERVFKS